MRMLFALAAAAVLLPFESLCAVKPPQPPKIDLKAAQPHPFAAGLLLAPEFKEYGSTKETKQVFPVGEHAAAVFEKNLPAVFKSVAAAQDKKPAAGMDLVIVPSVVKFSEIIPHPAYNPYRATAVLRVDVYDREGNKIFTQTATGEFQTSKGMMSGFRARKLLSQAGSGAIVNAIKQILEGLQDAPELKEYK